MHGPTDCTLQNEYSNVLMHIGDYGLYTKDCADDPTERDVDCVTNLCTD